MHLEVGTRIQKVFNYVHPYAAKSMEPKSDNSYEQLNAFRNEDMPTAGQGSLL